MKIKRLIKILISLIFVFLAFQINTRVNATNENYKKFATNVNIVKKYEIKGNGNITNELVGYLEDSKNYIQNGKYVMIYIPSGTYYLSDDNNLVVHSNTYLISENDTNLIKEKNTKNSIIRTRESENTANIYIYGGNWDSNNNGKNGIEILNSLNVKIQNLNVKNGAKNCININKSNVEIDNINILNSKESGILINKNSTVKIKNSSICKNKQYGICVVDSVLNANNNGNNNISQNDWSGISATGKNTEVYLHKNKILNNGINPKSTKDGQVGHGIGISEGAYANINNNIIKDNKECGISIFDNSKTKINNNVISNNGRHGIGARKKVNLSQINNNNISYNNYNGILLSDSSKAVLTKNTINNNKNIGLSVVDKSNAKLNSNDISYNKNSNISVSNGDKKTAGAKITLNSNNTINNSKKHGIVLSGNNLVEILKDGNQINNNNKNGISISDKSKLVINKKTTLKNNKVNGIYIKNSEANIKNVTITKNGKYGVCIENGGYLKISKSKINNNKNYGINISGKGTTARISENEINNNKKIGIMINNKAKVKSIEKNSLNKNGEVAIMLKKSSKAEKIQNNKITNHTKYGIASYKSTIKNVKNNKFKNPKAKKSIYKN